MNVIMYPLFFFDMLNIVGQMVNNMRIPHFQSIKRGGY